MDLKVHHVCLCGAKAPIGCKKYPAVAGYFIKWTINGPKRELEKDAPCLKLMADKEWHR
jgi:hypothetical protein